MCRDGGSHCLPSTRSECRRGKGASRICSNATYNTSKHNSHPIPPAQTPPPKINYTPTTSETPTVPTAPNPSYTDNKSTYQPHSLVATHSYKNPHKTCKYKANETPTTPTPTPPHQQLTNELMTFKERSLFDNGHFLQLWSSRAPGRLQSGASLYAKKLEGTLTPIKMAK